MKKIVTMLSSFILIIAFALPLYAGVLTRITNDNERYYSPMITDTGSLYFYKDIDPYLKLCLWNGVNIIELDGNLESIPSSSGDRHLIGGESIIYLVCSGSYSSCDRDLYYFDGSKSTKINPSYVTDVSSATILNGYIAFAGWTDDSANYQIFIYKLDKVKPKPKTAY